MATITPSKTRMERLLVPNNWLDRLQRSSDATKVYLRRTRTTFHQRRLGYHGSVEKEPMYSGTIDFSTDDGESFGQLEEPEGNRIVLVRLQLAQHNVVPLVMGFQLKWNLPNGWVFTDGLDPWTYEQFNSNPMTVTRSTRSPANPIPVGFKVRIGLKYR